MSSAVEALKSTTWFVERGLRQLEWMVQAIAYRPSAPVPIAEYERKQQSTARARALSSSHGEGRLDEMLSPFAPSDTATLWKGILNRGAQSSKLQIAREEGLRRKSDSNGRSNGPHVPTAWTSEYAALLIDPLGTIVTWNAGAEQLYGYSEKEVIGRRLQMLYPEDTELRSKLQIDLHRSDQEGHCGTECWGRKKNGDHFWANEITMAVKDFDGALQGYARIVRDFSSRLPNEGSHLTPGPSESRIAGIASGEFDSILEANDAFLEMVDYSREDLHHGRLRWQDLTPAEHLAKDEMAHEEGLRFGACTPFEKELISKNGARIPVMVATAILTLSPFRWISFIQDLRESKRTDCINEEVSEREHNFEEIVGRSTSLKQVLDLVETVAPTNATVLILGETGTGKELIARAIHRRSKRCDHPFVTLNCAAIPTGLLESELFGYERGAFTGALAQKIGRFEMAHRGTLFLDEVGDIPLDLQPKLLRALQEKSFERLGGTKTIPIDVRLVAATNRNLTQMLEEKLFRSDLYYRLKVFPITTPPLRDRPEDIPLLVRHFTQKYAREMNKTIDKIPSETMKALANWTWPGNIRELENFIERAVILSPGSTLRVPLSEIRSEFQETSPCGTLHEMEREHVLRALRETRGIITKAAHRLGMPRTTLNALMRKLELSRKDL